MTVLTDLAQRPYYQTAVDFGLVSGDDQALALAVQARTLAIFNAIPDKQVAKDYLRDPKNIQNLRNDDPHTIEINGTTYPVSDEVLNAAKAAISPTARVPDGVPLSGTISVQLGILTEAQKNSILTAQAAAKAAATVGQGADATTALREPFYSDREPDAALKAAQKLALDVTKKVNEVIANHPLAADASAETKAAIVATRRQELEALKSDPALGSAKILETFTTAAATVAGTPAAVKITAARDEAANGPLKAAEAAPPPAQPAAPAAPEKTTLTIRGATVAVAAYQEAIRDYLKQKGGTHTNIAIDGAWGKETNAADREAMKLAGAKTAAELGKKLEEAGIHWKNNKEHFVAPAATPAAPPAPRVQGH